MARNRKREGDKRDMKPGGGGSPPTSGGSSGGNKAGKPQNNKPKGNNAGGQGKGKKPAGTKHVNVVAPEARRTEGAIAKADVKEKVTARIKADKPGLKGGALKTRITKQTAASVARKQERGITVVGANKKKK